MWVVTPGLFQLTQRRSFFFHREEESIFLNDPQCEKLGSRVFSLLRHNPVIITFKTHSDKDQTCALGAFSQESSRQGVYFSPCLVTRKLLLWVEQNTFSHTPRKCLFPCLPPWDDPRSSQRPVWVFPVPRLCWHSTTGKKFSQPPGIAFHAGPLHS